MQKKATSRIALAVAVSGSALAVFVPAASAQTANTNQYCPYNEYSQYNQYCEPAATTPTANGTTAGTSSSVTITPSAGASSSSSSAGASPAVAVSADGAASISVADLKPGVTFTANGVAVKVLGYTANGVEVSFGGVAVDVPSTATVSVSKDGTVTVTYFVAGGKLIPAVRIARAAAAFHPIAATGQQDIILPAGKSSDSFSYVLNKGVSFGSKSTWAQVARNFTVEATGTRSLTGTAAHKLAKLALKADANKARSATTINLAKPEKSFIIKFNVANLEYSAAEAASITKHGVKTLSPTFTVTSKLGKHTTKTALGFAYPVV